MLPKRTKKCKECGLEFKPFNTIQKHCSKECYLKNKPIKSSFGKQKSIPLMSKKRKIENAQYIVLRAEFLAKKENQICFIDGCNKKSTTIEHRSGRWGKNFLDTSTWAGCCLEHNLELEKNSELSKKYQFSKITGKSKT
jgi:hypothetical protein